MIDVKIYMIILICRYRYICTFQYLVFCNDTRRKINTLVGTDQISLLLKVQYQNDPRIPRLQLHPQPFHFPKDNAENYTVIVHRNINIISLQYQTELLNHFFLLKFSVLYPLRTPRPQVWTYYITYQNPNIYFN